MPTYKYDINYWIKKYDLQIHPEGGYYKETHRSNGTIIKDKDERSISSDIYFLLGSLGIGHFSAWHRLKDIEEIWHFNYGDDITVYWFDEKGTLVEKILGSGKNAEMQVHIPANCWFAAVVNNSDKNSYSLVSCTCVPAFDFKDFKLAKRDELTKIYPHHAKVIQRFTR